MDVTITVAILQIRRKELKITWAGLTNKWKVVLSQQKNPHHPMQIESKVSNVGVSLIWRIRKGLQATNEESPSFDMETALCLYETAEKQPFLE